GGAGRRRAAGRRGGQDGGLQQRRDRPAAGPRGVHRRAQAGPDPQVVAAGGGAMSERDTPSAEDSLALAREVDRLCDAYEAALGGGAAALDDWLPPDEPRRGAALVELVRVELEHRLRSGEAARAEEYFTRYPGLAADPAKVFRVVAAEYRAR